ncbi:MAG TPA: hypothetical protein VKT51_00365 [Candidatus Eremiobacteraceae bacterium]|nr:hypothetical protein [Candidatus Eremiobacteraceae bacterium]
MRLGSIAFVFVLALALGACSSSQKSTASTDTSTAPADTSASGTATADANAGGGTASNSGGSMTINTKEGSVSMGTNVDASKIGVPVYPGATAAGGGGWSVQSKEGTGQVVSLTTNDSFGKVEAWYKAQFPAGSEVMNVSSGSTSSAVFQVGKTTDKDQQSVEISSDGTKTTIVLSHKTTTGS